jgi:hypothetical protein
MNQPKPCARKTAKDCPYWTQEPHKVSLCLKFYEVCTIWIKENPKLMPESPVNQRS